MIKTRFFGLFFLVIVPTSFAIFSCASGNISPAAANGSQVITWPLTAHPSVLTTSRQVSVGGTVPSFSAPDYLTYSSGDPVAQYDMILAPYNTSTNDYCAPVDDGFDFENAPRLMCLANGAQGEKVVPFVDGYTMIISWGLTDISNLNNPVELKLGAGADCQIDVNYVGRISNYQIEQFYIITAFKLKFTRENITDSGAAGYGKGMGYWFNRTMQFHYSYHYEFYTSPADNWQQTTNFSASPFQVLQNTKQNQVVFKSGNTNISNWDIDGSGNAGYSLKTSTAGNNALDTYTKELQIPNTVVKLNDNFAQTGQVLPSLEQLSEISRSSAYTIGANAFANKNLNILDIPNCSQISDSAFANNKALAVVRCKSLTTIGNSAFSNDVALRSFSGAMVSGIGQKVFDGCTSLVKVSLPALTSWPTDGTALSGSNIQQITIGAPHGAPLTYNKLLDGAAIMASKTSISNFSIKIPTANAETDPTKSGWATSYYNPAFGWANTITASGHTLAFFFSKY